MTNEQYLIIWRLNGRAKLLPIVKPFLHSFLPNPEESLPCPSNQDQLTLIPSRRDFLKTSMAAAAGAATLGGLALARSAHAAGSDVLRIGMIGCGDRGPGAAVNAMSVDPGVRLVAMTDIFPDRVQERPEDPQERRSRTRSRWTTPTASPAWTATST